MFWDAERWVPEKSPDVRSWRPASRNRLRKWLVTLPILFLTATLVFPMETAAASTYHPRVLVRGVANAGGLVTLVGRGFRPGGVLQARWDKSATRMRFIWVNKSGGFRVQLRIPATATEGSHKVTIGRTSPAAAVATRSTRLLRQTTILSVKVNVRRKSGLQSVPAPTPTPAPTGFLSRSGTTLTFNGAPHRLVGINIYTALWADYPYRADLTAALPQLPGVNAVRVFAFQASAIKDGVRDWSSWDDSLALFAQYGVKVIMVLTDHWGGQPVTDSSTDRSIGWYQSGYRTTVEGVSTYRDWVTEAVTRYRDDPTIGIWQLVNEGEARNADGTCSATPARDALRAFADDMAGLIKGIDPNHLVSLGTTSGGCGSNEADYGYIQAGPNLDVMDRHDYNYPDAPLGFDDASNGFTVSRDRAIANGKVFINGEIGIHWLAADPPITRAERASLFDAKLSAQFAAGSQGELLYNWHDAPVSDDPTRDLDVVPGDPALALLTLP